MRTAPPRSPSRTSTAMVSRVLKRKCGLSCAGERREPRARELLGEARHLDLACSRLGEVPDRMLDPDDCQVDGHAERQRDEQPAPEARGHPPSRADGMSIARSIVPAPAQAAQKSNRDRDMHAGPTGEVRPCQRPAPRGGEHRGREEGVDQPVAAGKKHARTGTGPPPYRRPCITTSTPPRIAGPMQAAETSIHGCRRGRISPAHAIAAFRWAQWKDRSRQPANRWRIRRCLCEAHAGCCPGSRSERPLEDQAGRP